MSPTQNAALVTDGLWRKSLSAIRSLGKAGFRVHVMGDSWLTTGFWSRYTAEKIFSKTAAEDANEFGKNLLLSLEKTPRSVVFPMEEASLEWVAQNLSLVENRGSVLLPSLDAFYSAQDKGKTIQIVKKLGIAHPETHEPQSAEELVTLISQFGSKPFVIKPRKGSGSSGVLYSESIVKHPQLEAFLLQHWEHYGRLLLQDRIPAHGKGQGVSLLMDREGECIATFAHERIQQYPNSGGPSTDRKSIHDPQIVEWSIALLKALHWKGIAMVEWKVDPRDGIPKIMEINPRFWGSLELAVRSGIDFPTLYAKAALGEKLKPQMNYPAQVRCRWFMPGEILRYLTQKPSDRESLWEFLKGIPHITEEWDPKDLRGWIATFICTALLALNPRYWKFVRRG